MKKLVTSLALLSLSGLAAAETANGFDLSAYGFIKASAMYTTEAVASYNNINLSAPTHAVAQTRTQDATSRMSFQTQQTRAGVRMKKGEDLSAQFEFDFIDFNKSSPTVQMNPRVRIAAVTYKWNTNHKVIIGQDWDMFSPVTSYTFDYVGLYFLAGNTGFMRQQAQYLYTQGDWEYGAALGMAGNNPGVADKDLELGKSPTYALRITRKFPEGRFGLSGIYSRLSYNQDNAQPTQPTSTHDAYAGNAFYEQQHGKLSVKSEVYYGQNLANIGALAIGKGTSTSDAKEFGGTLTGTYALTEVHGIFGGVGLAKIDNRSTLAPFAPQPFTSSSVITQPGIASNFLSRVGYEYKVTPDFSWITEFSRYETESKLAANDYQLNIVYGLESGVQLRF